MNRQLAARLIIDFAMTVLLLCAYAYRITGDAAHEWIGIAVFASFAVHNMINWRWYKSIFKGKYTLRRTIAAIVNISLAFTMAALFVTGLLQSRTVLAFLRLPGDMLLRQTHTAAAYWGLPLIGVHAGLHWEMIMNGFRKMTRVSGSSPARTVTLRAISVMIAVYGIYASFDRDMGSKLFLGYSFDYWNPDRPAILFFTSNLAIMGVYVCVTHYALKLLIYRQKRTGGAQ
jgi:glucan phosphoethanolaminetransferase (alkaline phosphatase superfamily)